MKILFQTMGRKNAVPASAPDWLKNSNHFMSDTERRIKLLSFLEENCVELNTISYISIKLHHELEEFAKTGKKDFHVYHCRDVFGFLYIVSTQSSFTVRQAYYQVKDIDMSRPWAIYAETKPNSNDIKEICGNAIIDKDNRILSIS